jgi:hypothetical protein
MFDTTPPIFTFPNVEEAAFEPKNSFIAIVLAGDPSYHTDGVSLF